MTEATLNFLLGDDGKSVAIEAVEGDVAILCPLDADQLSTVITNLGHFRAKVAPEIPRQLDANPLFSDVTRRASVYVGRVNKVSKEVYIAVRHDGYGWLSFAMSPESMVAIAGRMAEEAMRASGGSGLVDPVGKLLR